MKPRKMCHRLLFLTLVFVCALGAEFSGVPDLQVGEEIDMAVDSGGRAFLSAGTRLLRLDRDLNSTEDVTVTSSILQIALSSNGSKLVVCFADESCAVYDADNFGAGEQLIVQQASASADNLALFTSPNDTFYVGSEGSLPGSSGVVYLAQYGFGASPFERLSGTDFNVETSSFSRFFGGGFTQGMYAYYVVVDEANDDIAVRVVRVCDVDSCESPCDFATLYEAEVECGTGSLSEGQKICGVSLVENFLGSPGPTLVYSVCDTRNRICSVPLASIDSQLLATYNECSTSAHSINIAWDITSGALPMCTSKAPFTSECEHAGEPLALNNFNEIMMTLLLYNVGTKVSATLAISVEADVTLLYVGYTDGAEHFLAALHVQENATMMNFDGAFTTLVVSSPVTQIHWRDGLEYVYAANADSVFQVPLEQCSQLTDCQSCTASPNPLCGWCTVEQKCSRRSQCRNSSETMRWVEDDAQCINNAFNPIQFVVGIGQNVNVTVTPSLPPPLSGEMYSCQFKEADGPWELTTSATTEDNMLYTCNLDGTVPSFDGANLTIDFSFVSSLINISFGIEDEAVTFFNCPAAASCTECVSTDDACGWCIYNKLCRGTADGCTDSNETYWLRLDGAGSSDEVCPLLVPPPTPTGEYIQPVVIDRDLELITRNLPEPPSADFSYECSLMTSPGLRLPTAYINESSITCLVSASEIMLSPGTIGQESFLVQLEWVRAGAPPHPVDTLGGTEIDTLLYDCGGLGDSCSVCLAANTLTGFDCAWCGNPAACDVEDQCSDSPITDFTSCPSPTITSISPESGPPTGGTIITIEGTNLGVTYSDVDGSVYLGSIFVCNTSEELYKPGVEIGCETPDFGDLGTPVELPVTVVLESGNATGPEYSVETPSVTAVDPSFGPVSGGVLVTVTGTSLAIGNMNNTMVTFNGTDCPVQSIENTTITCTQSVFTGNSSVCDMALTDMDSCPERNLMEAVPVQVYIDGSAFPDSSSVEFEYRCNPIITGVSPESTIPAGGVTLTFDGCGTDVVQRPQLVVAASNGRRDTSPSTDCNSTSNTTVVCIMPPLPGSSEGDQLTYSLMFGNHMVPVVEALEITVGGNPSFGPDALLRAEIAEGETPPILLEIEGENVRAVEDTEYMVTVGGEVCAQARTTLTLSSEQEGVQCNAPPSAPGGVTNAEVMVFVGLNLNFSVGTIMYVERDDGSSDDALDFFGIGVAASAGIVVVIVIIVIASLSLIIILIVVYCYHSKAQEKDQKLTNLLAQMELWEIEMADECKKAFTELQTDLADIVQLSDRNLPYHDFRSFAMRFLFPSSGESHPVLMPVQPPPGMTHERVMGHLDSFRHLVMEKKFLLVFVRTLEAEQGRFTLQDKCNVASLLMVAFQNDLDYATDILQTLLTDLMRRAVSKSHPKLLLRATETVAEKMLANWLCFLLYPYLLEHVGEPLFILYHAIKSQLEKGPVDVITGDARHSLSEEKLLRQHLEVRVVEGVVETEAGEEVPIKLLDCDSITQAKEKILDALYKNTPVSQRPQLTQVDLELRTTGGITLRDQDQTNEKDGEWIKVNTLGHYKLQEMSQAAIENPKKPVPRFRLVPRPQRPVSGMSMDTLGTIIANMSSADQRSSLLPSELNRVYHLVKPETGYEGEEGGPHQGARIMSEVFLTRLLSTKRILQSYVDDLFHSIFAVPRGRPLPKAIKYLFDFLDHQAAELGIQDSDVLHTWKTNSLPLRFWVNVLKNPDFVFSINKSATMDSCLTVITQAYIDACSTSDFKYTKDTPSGRLLYVNEVKQYKAEVHQYYETIQTLPKLDPREMQEYLRETAQVCAAPPTSVHAGAQPDNSTRQLYFVTESALFELYKFASLYSDEIMEGLNEDGLITLAAKFGDLMQSFKVKS